MHANAGGDASDERAANTEGAGHAQHARVAVASSNLDSCAAVASRRLRVVL
jgi:hypothetical protein